MAQSALKPGTDSGPLRAALSLEGSGRVRFTLDEGEEDVEVQDELPLLSGGGGGGGSSAATGESSKRSVQRTVSRFTLEAEQDADNWTQYKHEAGR